MVLSCPNIVISFGTFILSLLNITDYTKRIFVPSYVSVHHIYNKNFEIIKIQLHDYKKQIGEWTNSKIQNDLMISYGRE